MPKQIHITKAECDALYAAIDFVRSNSDGADDHKPYDVMCKRMHSLWKKAVKIQINKSL